MTRFNITLQEGVNFVLNYFEQIPWLDQILLSELSIEHEQKFPVDTNVDVLFGPLKGIRGSVKQKNSKTKLVVWFDSIMQGVSVDIDPGLKGRSYV